MGTFTVQLKRAIEYTDGIISYEEVVFDNIKYILPVMTGGNIGLSNYPIFNEQYRPILNGKIIDHYWNREIGLETIDDFQLATRRKMNEIMPYYNKLYQSELIDYDALKTIDIQTVSHGDMETTEQSNSTQTGNNTSTTGARNVNSNTPQTMLARDKDYASGATDVRSETATNLSGASDGTANTEASNDQNSRTTGFQGSASDLIMRYRDSLLNIDLLIINDLEELFMQLLNNGDTYTKNGYFW